MAKVYIINDDKWVDVPDGENLGKLDGQSSILFACHEGVCGSCLSHIVEGKENLEEPSDYEKQMLEMMGASEDQRLLCITKIKGGEVKVKQ
ncbi:MAG: (2Fe-2S)-binding protein [Methanobacteriota archaeon]|nr:MAG: (2Fe-2S)-binding protein [Euryarchaeota archaeon]